MEIIAGPRHSGRTTKLIELAAKTDGTIVCSSTVECWRIVKVAKKMDLNIKTPITFPMFSEKNYSTRTTKGFLIDNMDAMISMGFRVESQQVAPIIAATILSPTLLTPSQILTPLNDPDSL